MTSRPTSVTVICWVVIVLSVLSLLPLLFSVNNPEAIELMKQTPLPLEVQFGWAFASVIAGLICAVAMLKGKRWGRTLYVVWSVVSLLLTVFTTPDKLMVIPGVIILAIVVFFLYRPKANAFFAAAA